MNPLYSGPPDLRDIIDRFAEGDESGEGGSGDEVAGDYESPYQGVTEGYGGGHDVHDIRYNNPENRFNADGSITGRATRFATPKDLAVYAAGGGLKYGDNGVGYYGHNTAGSVPYVAVSRTLLRQTYGHENAGKGQFVEVTAPNGRKGIFEIGDVGPRIKSANQPLIELNDEAARQLGSGDANGYNYRLLPRQ
jgi:hypothetical protein